jgi:hypothetical protein
VAAEQSADRVDGDEGSEHEERDADESQRQLLDGFSPVWVASFGVQPPENDRCRQ